MKKLYFIACMLFFGITFAQQNTEGPTVLSVDGNLSKSNYVPRPIMQSKSYSRAPGDSIYYENFADPFNNGWTTSGTGSSASTFTASELWLHDLDGPNGFYSLPAQTIQSTTVNDGFLILDGDFFNGNGNQPNTVETFHAEVVSPVYNLAGFPNVSVSFQHNYRLCCSSAESQIWMEVSTDGFNNVSGTYDLTQVGADINVNSGTREWFINITNAISGNPANTQIRFRWGTAGANTNASHYFWQIDDLAVYETYGYHGQLDSLHWSADLATFGRFGGFQKIPQASAYYTTLSWSGSLRNIGAEDWINAVLQVDQNGSSFATSSPTIVTAESYSTLQIAEAPMPTTIGSYSYSLYGKADQTMDVMDTATFDISVTQNAYSTGGDVQTGILSGTNWDWTLQPQRIGFGGEIIHNYPYLNYGIFGVNVAFQDTSINAFAPMEVVIMVNGDEVRNQGFTVDGSVLGSFQYVDLSSNIVALNPHDIVDYLVVDSDGIGRFIESGTDAYHIGIIATYDGTNTMTGPYLANPAKMEMIVDFFGGISEQNNNISSLEQNIPNPFGNITIIKYQLKGNDQIQLEIRDVAGKLIKYMDLGQKQGGAHQIELNAFEFGEGIYFYTLIAGDSKMTKKMVITK